MGFWFCGRAKRGHKTKNPFGSIGLPNRVCTREILVEQRVPGFNHFFHILSLFFKTTKNDNQKGQFDLK